MVSVVQNGAPLIWRGRERGYRQQGDLAVYIPFLAGALVGERAAVKVRERERRQWHPHYEMGHHLLACRVVVKVKVRGRGEGGVKQEKGGVDSEVILLSTPPFLLGLVRQRAAARA
jgi:hypothetical protein